MRVDQAGKQSAVAEVDHFGIGRPGNRTANFDDALALNQHFAGCDHMPGFDVEQARGVQDDGVFRRVSQGGTTEQNKTGAKKPEHDHCARS